MPTVLSNAPSSTTTTSPKPDGVDYEPDDEWKLQLGKRDAEDPESMVADAEEKQAAELRKSPVTPETPPRPEASYKQAMQTIEGLATEQYQFELDHERNQRRSALSKPSNEPPTLAPTLLPMPPSPSPRPTEGREKSFSSPQSVRRGSDARSTLSRDHDEPPGSSRRGYHPSTHERPTSPDNWAPPDTVEEPNDILRPAPPRARLSSTDRHSQPSPVSTDKRDSSMSRSSGSIHSTDRHVARSLPVGPPPEVGKPAISPGEDALPAKTYKLGRRGSAESVRSTRPGASIRPSIMKTSPERADDERPDELAIEENDHEWMIEQGRTWISTEKPYEKEKWPRHRRNSRPFPVDVGFRPDEPLGSSGLRSAGSSTMEYAIPAISNEPLPRLQTPPARYSSLDRDQPQDQPSASPIPTRSLYDRDDRDYLSPYSTLHRSHGPNSPPYHSQPRPISRQASYTRQSYADDDDDRGRERLWERDYDRDRDRDGGRYMYSEQRYGPSPDTARPASSHQIRPPDDPGRSSGESDDYSRDYSPAPIRRHTPVQPDAWIDWAAEGNRHPNYDYPQQVRSPPNVEPFSHRPFMQPLPSYHNSPRHPNFGGRDTDSWHRGNSTVADEYNSGENEDEEDSDSSEDEAKKMRDLEARKQKLEESRREADDELKRTEVEIQRLAAEEARKKGNRDEKRKEERQKKEEARRREEVFRKKEDEVRRKEVMAKRKEEEAAKKEEEAKRMREEAKEEEEAKRKEREAKRKEQAAKIKEEEEIRQRGTKLEGDKERAKQMPSEALKIVEDALKKQKDLKKMEEARKKDMEMKKKEDILRRREEELMRREADNFRREAEIKTKEEAMEVAAMMERASTRAVESKLTAEQRGVLQRAEFRKMEELIRRTLEEERKHDYSGGNDDAWSNLLYSPDTSLGIWPPPQFDGTSAPVCEAGPAPAQGPSIKPTAFTSNCSSSSTSIGKPKTGSVSSGTYSSEADRTHERALRQQEQFRLTQAKLEAERQLKSAGRPLSRQELQRVFENHERLWNRLNTLSELSWNDFPWPMAKPPFSADDMSLSLIGAYIQSPVYPDKNKSQTTKDRIKEHIRRWHPDRFETKFLPKVIEDERKKVKHGAENVVSYLRDLLMKENDKQKLEESRREADDYESDEAEDDGNSKGEIGTRDLEAKMRKLEEDKKDAEAELDRLKIELQRTDKAVREDEEKRKEERGGLTYDEQIHLDHETYSSVCPNGQTTFVVYGIYSFITALYLLF